MTAVPALSQTLFETEKAVLKHRDDVQALTGKTMKNSIVKSLKRKRSMKDLCSIAILVVAVAVELTDAAFGIKGLATGSDLAASNVVDVADVMVGAASAWVLHG